MPTFPLEEFIATFPNALGYDPETGNCKYSMQYLSEIGNKAMMHISPERAGMPMRGYHRFYAQFLCALHMIELDEKMKESGGAEGGLGGGLIGMPFKATIGSVQLETTKPNTFTTEDWDYWYKQTPHGMELLAFLEEQAPIGIFLNNACDSVRDLV